MHNFSKIFLTKRSHENEILDDFKLSGIELKDNLRDIDFFNRWLGGKNCLITALSKLYKNQRHYFHLKKLLLIDLGSGSGQLLQYVHSWGRKHDVHLQLVGFDANNEMTQYALDHFQSLDIIEYHTHNFFLDHDLFKNADIITLNSLCHHLNDEEIVNLIKKLSATTKFAIIINDLQRNLIAFLGCKLLMLLPFFSPISRIDGPLSIRRAFTYKDLKKLFSFIPHSKIEINKKWGFRWQIIIDCRK